MKYLPIPTRPWQIVSQDLCQLKKQRYLVSVCHFYVWIEVDKLEDTLSLTIIEKTKGHFARYGVPAICHTDNGPQNVNGQTNDLYRLSTVSSFVGQFSMLVSALHHTYKGSDLLHKRCQMFQRKKPIETDNFLCLFYSSCRKIPVATDDIKQKKQKPRNNTHPKGSLQSLVTSSHFV